MFTGFELSANEQQAGFDAIVAKAANGDDLNLTYQPLARASMEAFDRGVENAVLAVPTQMVLDGALAIMRQPTVMARLPKEIHERKLVALFAARQIGEVGAASMIFASVFTYTPELRALSEDLLPILTDGETIGKLGAAAFNDAGNVIGGAHRLLKRRPLREPIADIIARSTSLPGEISRIDEDQTDRAFQRLGRPYVLPRHLHVVTEGGVASEVIFTEGARLLIRSLIGRDGGCPAARMGNVQGNGTYLTDAWANIVSVFVPEDATSKLRNTS